EGKNPKSTGRNACATVRVRKKWRVVSGETEEKMEEKDLAQRTQRSEHSSAWLSAGRGHREEKGKKAA
ncbi:MAG TPA: hypothetical protein VGR58_07120, partial [Candidatus Acidoferrum sp.]|nr:hypothetical protein [Candidatus Acidoferrum sp.]